MSDEIKAFNPKYDDNKKEDIIYLRPVKTNNLSEKYRKIEMLYDEELYLNEKVSDTEKNGIMHLKDKHIAIAVGEGGQQKIYCNLVEYHPDDWDKYGKRGTLAFKIARRTSKGVYGSEEITLTLSNANKIADFIKVVLNTDNELFDDNITKVNFNLIREKSNLKSIKITEKEYEELINSNISNIEALEKIAVIKAREEAIHKLERIINGEFKNETDINHFLKKNMWMFGNDYVAFLENGKLNDKNLLDLVPYNSEYLMDIVELKLPGEKIVLYDSGHKNYYISSELTKAIGQVQNYIFEAEQKGEMTKTDDKGNYKFIRPNGIILAGNKDELTPEENKYLRVLNSSYHNIRIITYQQLLAKAKNSLSLLIGNKL